MEPFHGLSQQRAESSEPGTESQGAAAMPGNQAKEGTGGRALRSTSGLTHRLVAPNVGSKDVHVAVLRPPGESQPRVEPRAQGPVPSVEGTDGQVTQGAGTDQIGNNSLLRRSDRRVARPVG